MKETLEALKNETIDKASDLWEDFQENILTLESDFIAKRNKLKNSAAQIELDELTWRTYRELANMVKHFKADLESFDKDYEEAKSSMNLILLKKKSMI